MIVEKEYYCYHCEKDVDVEVTSEVESVSYRCVDVVIYVHCTECGRVLDEAAGTFFLSGAAV